MTVRDMLFPAAKVSGSVGPLTLNPAPLEVACEMLKLLVVVLVMLTLCVLLEPTVTVPKLTLAGLAASEPLVAAPPVPERATFVGELLALLTTDMAPLTVPVAVGENLTEKDVLCPAAKVSGSAGPLNVMPTPLTVADERVALPVPLLVIVTDFVLLEPTVTVPKARLVGLAASWVTLAAPPAPDRPTAVVEVLLAL